IEEFDGWGRSVRSALRRWYATRSLDALGREALAQQGREGFGHRDVLRLAYPAGRASAGDPAPAVPDAHARLYEWIVRGAAPPRRPRVMQGFVRVQCAGGNAAAALVREYRLPREALGADHLGCAEVWCALLEQMPASDVMRNLAAITSIGLLRPGSAASALVLA